MKDLFKTARFWVLWAGGLLVLAWYFFTDPDGGLETFARLQWMAWVIVAAGPVYLLRRALMDGARGHQAYLKALDSPTGAGLVFLGLCLLTGLLFMAMAGQARAEVPDRAKLYLPVLGAEIDVRWPGVPHRSALAAQVEQETCPSLKSAKCWNPRAELKTAREYGFGLGQLTVTTAFDNFAEARKLDVSLRDWRFEDRYDASRQLRTMVLMDKGGFQRLAALVSDPQERLAMAFSAYNGGLGGVLSDRRLCAQVKGCDPGRWFGHVERYSLKAKTKTAGYGLSFYEINRAYVRNILFVRRQRYAGYFGEV